MSLVTTEINGKVASVIFSRPEKLNALSMDMRHEFIAAMDALKYNDDVSVVIVRGDGRAFSVGADVAAGHEGYTERVRTLDDWLALRELVDMWLGVWRFPKPTIAAIHGYVMGIATGIAVCCDITIIAEDAVVGWPSVPLGAGLLGPASEWIIGPKKAKEMSYVVGSRMSGLEAKEWGWANHAVPADEVVDRATRLANRIAKTPLELLKVKKVALNRVMDIQGFSEALQFGAELDAIAHDSNSVDETVAGIKSVGLRDTIASFTSEDPS